MPGSYCVCVKVCMYVQATWPLHRGVDTVTTLLAKKI